MTPDPQSLAAFRARFDPAETPAGAHEDASDVVLFVHIPKNAGRSIETALLGGLGSPDGGRRNFVNRAAPWLARRTAPKIVV